jgi:lipopolysaccharide export LptBFGC system permease protein LptF
MKRISRIISRYLITTIAPYFIFSWMLLSVILFVQQAGRYSDIFFSVNIPTNLVWQLTFALVPNVIAFTCPMAMLVATIIGLTKMQGDSELVAIRASGVGNLQIAIPIILFGIVLSVFAFFVNFRGVPLAASLVRTVALQTAIKKLESPIEPGVFNSEVAGFTIYAKGGDLETGRWKNIFIYHEDKDAGTIRLITSLNGRIDTTGQMSELVLEDASVSTLPMHPGSGKYVSENIEAIRFGIKTKRSDLIEKLSRSEITADEMGLQQLSEFAATATGAERVEAQLIWQRRVLLSITPLIFSLLGTMIVLRFNRGGRGFGILAALVVLVGFYLLAFIGEQLARLNMIDVFAAAVIPIAGSVVVIAWFGLSRRVRFSFNLVDKLRGVFSKLRPPTKKVEFGNIFVDLTTGLRDFDIVRNLIKNYLMTVIFLAAIFQIFTAFELWRFAGAFEGGIWVLLRYLIYLMPFVYLQIAPSAAMIATLATYVIKSRNNEIVTWTSSGQSVYRLLLPCFLLALLLGGVNWLVQEQLLPKANQLQESTRTFIRNRGVGQAQPGKLWVATDRRIYSFDLAEGGLSGTSMSDSEGRGEPCAAPCVRNLTVYEFAENGRNLQVVYRADGGFWQDGAVSLVGNVEINNLSGTRISSETKIRESVEERSNPFAGIRLKPNQVNSSDLKLKIANADSELEARSFEVALEKKYATLVLPLVMVLFSAPFSLSLSRKGKAAAVGYAVGLWLLFTGTSTVFEQLGLNGLLSSKMAVWSPLVLFSLFGVYLLSKVKT